jgi:hypothetical protein
VRNLNWRLPSIVTCLFVCFVTSSRPASAAPKFSPSGPQKVLVVLADLGSTLPELCPVVAFCPLGILTNLSLYQPPRHTAQQWESLLNQYGPQFWGFASYGQTQVEFKVLANPERPDGWWTPPHSAQTYYANQHIFLDYKTFAETSDPARFAIDSYCAGLSHLFFCSLELPQYDRLVVMSNFKAQGGVSAGPFTLNTVSKGPLQFTMTLINESMGINQTPADSLVLATLMHEFGHQLGIPSHYGNCSIYNNFAIPSNYVDPSYPFAPPAPPGYLECLQYWDIMGAHWRWSQPSGFSRVSRGWVDPQTTISYQLPTASPFNALHLIAPVEVTPGLNGVPNLIRLSHGQLSDPWFWGLFVECRVHANGDEGLYPKSGGIPGEGLVITNVHESSVFDSRNTPPAHVVLPHFPGGTMDNAYLGPGDSFTDNWNMTVRFNGFTPGAGADRLCDVEIAYGKPLLQGPIVMWQNRVAPGPEQGTGLSTDVGINQIQPAPPAGTASPNPPLGMAPLWPNHVNTLFARAHTLGTIAAENVKLSVHVTQPAVIESSCGTLPEEPTGEIALPPVDPVRGAMGAMRFVARRGSLGAEFATAGDPATGLAGNHLATTNVAYLFFPAGAGRDVDPSDPAGPVGGVAPAPGPRGRATHFTLRANPGCGDETSFTLQPGAIPEGWSASVSPQVVSLAPGEAKDVTVRLRPPATALPGDHAEVTVNVHQAEESPAGPADAELPIDSRLAIHHELVGSLQVLGRVVGDPASVDLACSDPPAGGPLRVVGRVAPAPAPSQVILEYRRGRSAADTRFVTTDARGVFRNRFLPAGHGPWRVRAFWPGDAGHAPAQSAACLAHFGRPGHESSDASHAGGKD